MKPQNNILEYNFFKAWNEGELNTKTIFNNLDSVHQFTHINPGIYVGFAPQINNRVEELYNSLCFMGSSQLEFLKNGFVGATLNLGCNIFWYTNMIYKKKEFDFLEDGYTIMEIKMYDPVQTKELELV